MQDTSHGGEGRAGREGKGGSVNWSFFLNTIGRDLAAKAVDVFMRLIRFWCGCVSHHGGKIWGARGKDKVANELVAKGKNEW